MTGSAIPLPTARKIESLLGSLAGIVSARVVLTSAGDPAEIHVLAEPSLHPKQVVRNVESALSAGMGLEIDRRIVSVASVEATSAPEEARHAENGAGQGRNGRRPALEADETDEGRVVFVRMDSTSASGGGVLCKVTLRSSDGEHVGEGLGPATPQGRTEAGARAVFAALAAVRGGEQVVLESAMLLSAHGRRYVLVAAHALEGRQSAELAGLAVLDRSAEEAAVLAALQAANRWTTRLSQ